MTKVSISGGKLIIDVQGLHKIWALKSRLEIPIEHISAVRRAADERVKGIRLPGTSISGLITAGTYYEPNEKPVFWDACDREKAMAIDYRMSASRRLSLRWPTLRQVYVRF